MRQLFIPEIGTEITLAQDWTFTLYPERRNEKLFDKLKLPFHTVSVDEKDGFPERTKVILNKEQEIEFDAVHEACYTGNSFPSRWNKNELEREFDTDKYWIERSNWIRKNKDNFVQNFTIKFDAGTILRIDRIYIRKGNSEYSSISFWIKNGLNKGARFWAKLDEVNTIHIE